jgi:hypothetical protein
MALQILTEHGAAYSASQHERRADFVLSMGATKQDGCMFAP